MNWINNTKKYYESKTGVKEYLKSQELQKPEQTILSKLKNKLKGVCMLDIGVGTGRTTKFFVPLTKKYIGIDYSPSMIDTVKKIYGKDPNTSFKVCNAKDMKCFKDSGFDFILFSFNGIDCLPYLERINCLKEIRRIGKKDSFFCFSSHNILSLEKEFKIPKKMSFLQTIKMLIQKGIFLLLNKNINKLKQQSGGIIKVFANNILICYYYINPLKQIEQLQKIGFKDIECFSLKGKKIPHKELKNIEDSWIYYLCKVKK